MQYIIYFSSFIIKFLLQDNPDMHPNTDVPVNDDAFISGIFHSTIKEFDLIYSGEIMGIVSNHKIDDM